MDGTPIGFSGTLSFQKKLNRASITIRKRGDRESFPTETVYLSHPALIFRKLVLDTGEGFRSLSRERSSLLASRARIYLKKPTAKLWAFLNKFSAPGIGIEPMTNRLHGIQYY